jgi:hypothetical protein
MEEQEKYEQFKKAITDELVPKVIEIVIPLILKAQKEQAGKNEEEVVKRLEGWEDLVKERITELVNASYNDLAKRLQNLRQHEL